MIARKLWRERRGGINYEKEQENEENEYDLCKEGNDIIFFSEFLCSIWSYC